VEDEYGHDSVTTAWILRLPGGLIEVSSSWIGIVVDMVHWDGGFICSLLVMFQT
jgi:hypothetical protein